MNNFNKVFTIVKDQCGGQTSFAAISCFEAITGDANVPLDKLPLYLNHLQGIGLINYPVKDKFICLTSFGRRQERITKA